MTTYSDGIHDISNEDYHASDGVSRSKLMALGKSPMHFKSPKEFKESATMALGSLVHCLVLEPHLFDDDFAVVPEINKRTKLGKIQWEAFKLAHNGKTLVTDEQIAAATAMTASLKSNKDALRLLVDDTVIEHSIFWTDKESGLQFKCRPDAWVPRAGLIIDLKTTADASPWNFSSSAYKYGYWMQAAMIKEALDAIKQPMTRFIILAVENTAPYVPAVYVLDEESIDKAVLAFKRMALQLEHCISKNDWPDYGSNMLVMPKYAEYSND